MMQRHISSVQNEIRRLANDIPLSNPLHISSLLNDYHILSDLVTEGEGEGIDESSGMRERDSMHPISSEEET